MVCSPIKAERERYPGDKPTSKGKQDFKSVFMSSSNAICAGKKEGLS